LNCCASALVLTRLVCGSTCQTTIQSLDNAVGRIEMRVNPPHDRVVFFHRGSFPPPDCLSDPVKQGTPGVRE
jgi:hypothetical protein